MSLELTVYVTGLVLGVIAVAHQCNWHSRLKKFLTRNLTQESAHYIDFFGFGWSIARYRKRFREWCSPFTNHLRFVLTAIRSQWINDPRTVLRKTCSAIPALAFLILRELIFGIMHLIVFLLGIFATNDANEKKL